MTRAEIGDALWSGRMSIAEAEAEDPTLVGLRELAGITEEEAQVARNLSEADDLGADTPAYRYVDEIEGQLADDYRADLEARGIDPYDVGQPWAFDVEDTRAAVADAVQEGRMSPAEAVEADPSLAHLATICGLAPAEVDTRFVLDTLGVEEPGERAPAVEDAAPEPEAEWTYDDGPGLP